MEGAERGGFGLTKEDQDWVEFILMRNQEENGDGERNKKLEHMSKC